MKWADVDWLNGTLRVERGIVLQIVDDVKTDDSRRTLTIASDLLEVLKLWKRTAQFSANEDWIFASPVQIGRLPYSYTGVKQDIQHAAEAAGIGHLRTHTFRHTYRTELGSIGTPVAVQHRLMRHADIRTTMNLYGGRSRQTWRKPTAKLWDLCYPLTVTDHASRYLLCGEALSSTCEDYAFTVFERLFQERGLPANIRSDNGVPFASAHALFNLRLSLSRQGRRGHHLRTHLSGEQED